ncbi:hypothetical protein [Paenibacillus sp.]|uniref:hypothetical protein n=1 Tax=Paenibacillus sp. TaxID=58172 RepID=UPI002D5FBFD9|nr:hypothetical protein [Paenibacillus sp.]HZG88362.1 hypothetical protein [Paenibacillus sp.]
MRKVLAGLLCAGMLLGGASAASAHAGHSAAKLSVLVNGVEVASAANHVAGGKTYVSVEAFAALFGGEAAIGADRKSATVNGKSVPIRMKDGVATAWARDLASAVGAQSVTWDQEHAELYILALPEGTIQLEPIVVPAMGEHWANPVAGDLPTGPIYGVYKGKLIFLEYMIAQEDFAEGVNFRNLPGMKGVPSPAVVQTDIEFQPTGHPGMEIPHYDIHMYFITDEEQQAIK